MNRYIDADLVEKKLAEEGFHCPTMPVSVLIKSIPTADVRENVRGEWIDLWDRYRCSVCNMEHTYEENFCPNCGADMRGEEHVAD